MVEKCVYNKLSTDKTSYSHLLKVNYFLIRLLQSPLTSLLIFYSMKLQIFHTYILLDLFLSPPFVHL